MEPLKMAARQPDLIIAATTALHRRLTVVSRDVSDYQKARVPVLNPWVDRCPRAPHDRHTLPSALSVVSPTREKATNRGGWIAGCFNSAKCVPGLHGLNNFGAGFQMDWHSRAFRVRMRSIMVNSAIRRQVGPNR
jgi:hypothetical protein